MKVNGLMVDEEGYDSAWFSSTNPDTIGYKYADGSAVLYNGWASGYGARTTGCGYLWNNGLWYVNKGCNNSHIFTICQEVGKNYMIISVL